MFIISKVIISIFMVLLLSLPVFAECVSTPRIEKKPDGLRKENPDPSKYLTLEDRNMWKSVLKWCDECDERAMESPTITNAEGRYGGIFVDPLDNNQYIVFVTCRTAMQDGEHLIYKVTEHPETIESRLLHLEQYFPQSPDGSNRKQKREFIRFTDTLVYGSSYSSKNIKRNQFSYTTYYIGAGSCGKYYLFDVSGNCPRMIEFRERDCTPYDSSYIPPQKWKLYPAKERAKWKAAPSPYRQEWKDQKACTQ